MLGLSRLGFEQLIFQSSKHIGIKEYITVLLALYTEIIFDESNLAPKITMNVSNWKANQTGLPTNISDREKAYLRFSPDKESKTMEKYV